MTKRHEPRHFSLFYRFAYNVARIPVSLVTKRNWSGSENIPHNQGFVAVANHVSEVDSLTFMHFLIHEGRVPMRVLCKEELFRTPGLGWILRKAQQIPVARSSKDAGQALTSAVNALKYGECIGVFAEGTLTRDPDYWPMKPKTGAARMALQARVPVLPVAQWGAQDILDRYMRKPDLWPAKTVTVCALPVVDLSDLYDRADDPEAWEEASMRIMEPIRQKIGQIRGLTPPEPIWDRKVHGDLGKKGLAQMQSQWALDEPIPSARGTIHRTQEWLEKIRQENQ